MPFQETITIINNSGKIIKTGRHLVDIFKEAKASYQEKKAALRSDRALKRSQTFQVYDETTAHHDNYHQYDFHYEGERRRSVDETASHARSHRSHGSGNTRRPPSTSTRHKEHHASRSRPALTETNLRTLTEVSATTASAPPRAYRSPYAETAPRDMALSRPTLVRSPTELPITAHHRESAEILPRSYSETSLRQHKKEIDMRMAYGSVPPDLESRVDLDPDANGPHSEDQARHLVSRVESLLDEAHCVHHTATSIIAHLQNNPDAAAAVALTLAELSNILTHMSPAFLGMIKGASPAVFALLASPQFLIGAGVAVGITVVMFGGWKIVKSIKEAKQAQAAHNAAMAFDAAATPDMMPEGAYHEALILEDEISTIESWRRGIAPLGEEDGTAEIELISPEAEKAMKRRHREKKKSRATATELQDDLDSEVQPSDSISQVGLSEASGHSHRSNRSRRSYSSRHERDSDPSIPERKSSRSAPGKDAASRASSDRSRRTTRTTRTMKTIEAKKEDDAVELVIRSKDKKGSNLLKSIFKKKKEKEEKEKVLA